MGTGKYTGDSPSGYFTPASFCWGDTCDDETTRNDPANTELSGIWIAKFEIAGNITDEVQVVPSLIRNTYNNSFNVSTLFMSIKNQLNGDMGKTNYGLSGNYDTHMIKNTEWGAFVYLSQSKYGKYGNSNYTEVNKEVYKNNYAPNNNGYPTQNGCSEGTISFSVNADSDVCISYYSGLEGTGASTTGTIYGIYDTSGGSIEYVMGNLGNSIASSGFSSMPAKRYYNLYTKLNKTSGGIKGDAINDYSTEPFYKSRWNSFSPSSSFSWLLRGGIKGNKHRGMYDVSSLGGYTYNNASTRFSVTVW